jgi:putative oxidoreductase
MNTIFEQRKDAFLLVARLLMMVLFILFGWAKLTSFSGTQAYMAATGAPLPALSAVIAIVMELAVGIAIAVGIFTRPLAVLLALYTLGTALIGHRFWTQTGMEHLTSMINFYKNISIMGGLLLLAASGAGKYSIDRH